MNPLHHIKQAGGSVPLTFTASEQSSRSSLITRVLPQLKLVRLHHCLRPPLLQEEDANVTATQQQWCAPKREQQLIRLPWPVKAKVSLSITFSAHHHPVDGAG